jgi:hypothetical protein
MNDTIRETTAADPLERVTTLWYRADTWGQTISRVPVVEVTDHTVVVLENAPYSYGSAARKREKRLLRGENPNLFPTEEEARGYIIRACQDALERTQREVERQTAALEKIRREHPDHPAFSDAPAEEIAA